MIKSQSIFPLVITLMVFMIFSHNDVLALLGENLCGSNLGLEGFKKGKTTLQLYSVCSAFRPLKNTTVGVYRTFLFSCGTS